MTTPATVALYKGYRFPAEIFSHGVWLYFRFSLSYRDGEELMAERGDAVTPSPTKPFGSGASSLGRPMPLSCVASVHGPGTNGTWTRSS